MFTKEKKLLILFAIIFIALRSINFQYHLNFSTDQARFSSKALEMWNEKRPLFIGPTFSINLSGRYMYHGPYIYYFQLIFLLLGNFDPIVSSYLFMLFCATMIFPLYYGTKLLINQKAALLMVSIYTLFPVFVHYTRFFWNPNFQLALSALLVYLMGLFKKNHNKKYFFVLSLLLSIIFQFHYQFLFVVLGFLIYYFVYKKIGWMYFLIFLLGFVVGFIPLIIYELTHHFYNLSTLKLFIENWDSLMEQSKKNNTTLAPHYFLTISFFALLLLFGLFKNKISLKLIYVVSFISLFWSLYLYLPMPAGARGMADDWNYLDELKAHNIIKQENLKNYNVANLIYDTLAEVQKYLLRRDGVQIEYDDYIHNDYLYVLTDKDDYMGHPAYEVNTFKPSKLVKKWDITKRYKLYLLKRGIG